MQRNIYIQNQPLEEALHLFITRLEEAGFFLPVTETIATRDSLGRVCGQPVFARRSSPHYIASAMDGIAVKASSTNQANELNPLRLEPETGYLEVDTGDYIPPNFDAVIMIEDVNFVDGKAEIIKPAVPWQHIRSVGEDLVAHDLLVTSQQLIGPYELAAFHTAAVKEVEVLRKPRVAIIPTGTELVDEGSENMAPGEIVESNSRMLAALCREWGAEPSRHSIVIDDRELLRQAVLETKDQADMLVICSGSSAGREDYTASIVAEFGEVLVHGLAIRPGKPAILGIIDNKPVIGVPGYPVSAALVFNLFARPVLFRRQGLAEPKAEELSCRISRKVPSPMGVDEFIYVNVGRTGSDFVAYPLSRGAGISTSLVKADGVLQIPRGQEGLNAGAPCTINLFTPRRILENTLISIGSHDLVMDLWANFLVQHNLRLVSTNAGSMGGIMALKRGETHLSGIHLLDADTGNYNISFLKRFVDQNWLLLHLVKRQQGLIVAPGNPLGLNSIHDLLRDGIRYVNRQPGAGTRILLDYLLKNEDLNPACINGYNREEYTHLAVAAAVKNGAADAGLGIYAAARALELDFIPIIEEEYDLCILPDLLTTGILEVLQETLQSRDFRREILACGGYDPSRSGTVKAKANA